MCTTTFCAINFVDFCHLIQPVWAVNRMNNPSNGLNRVSDGNDRDNVFRRFVSLCVRLDKSTIFLRIAAAWNETETGDTLILVWIRQQVVGLNWHVLPEPDQK